MPYGFGATLPQRQASARKIRPLLCLPRRGFSNSRPPTPESDSKKLACNSPSRRDIRFGFSRIYPQSGFKLQTVIQNDCDQKNIAIQPKQIERLFEMHGLKKTI